MISKKEAIELVQNEVCKEIQGRPDDELIVLEDEIIEKPWGWIIFYTSKKWWESKDLKYAIAGNAPIIVEKETGELLVTGTAHSIEYYINNYEQCGNPHG